ncbi:MCE family protein [Haloechinothrix sp. YIM 98757]|uniref:MCE family protein n=1 Tax=Haloechinothrix aidingensis TaxID=2752311 RepID=A0A838ABB4_9PSEU|nr:MlaD family protein [Haloechinothrix aidingensis]MBA0126498.1 MCE family protein [Haloechinothrix aidingensis]
MAARNSGVLASVARSPVRIGVVLIVVVVAASVALFYKQPITTVLSSGEKITVHFDRAYGLEPYASEVKVSGVEVGTVTGVDRVGEDDTAVAVKVERSALEKLGSQPSAAIRPTTLLGGNYYVDLATGGLEGEFDGVIPTERTETPVELGQVVNDLQPDTLEALQGVVPRLDHTLGSEESRSAIDELLESAPDTMEPAGEVLDAARGTEPATDLPELVGGLESVGAVLNEQDGQLESIVDNMATTSRVLGERSADIGRTVERLPTALAATESGLKHLDGSLDTLEATADDLRPLAGRLNDTLDTLEPVLVTARPVVRDLRELMGETRPLVDDLIPATRALTRSLEDVRGPVMDRVDGPITENVLSDWHGSGPYEGGGADRPFYKELGYMFSNFGAAISTTDANGAAIGFHVGFGTDSVAGMPVSLTRLFEHLTGLTEEVPR